MTYRSRRTRLVLFAFSLLTLAVLVAGCGPANQQNSLRPSGEEATKIDELFMPIVVVATFIGIFVTVGVVYCAVKFRARPGRDERPKQTHGNTALEIGWTLIPAVILAVIAVPTVSLIFQLNDAPEKGALEVTAVGKQWWWQFDYSESGPGTKVVTANELHVPVGREVNMTLRACDPSLPGECNVIHSFWVPELNGKRDVIPGRQNTLTFTATKTGTFLGQCAEYCGLSHANMRFRVIVQTPDEFADWLAAQREGPAVTVEAAGEAGKLYAQKYACTNCHASEDSSISSYGPNLTHLASRTTFASGYYPLNRQNLIDWIYNAPSMIPMESKDCRLGLGVATCVGMPSFSEDTPEGQPTMTRAEAAEIADYLLLLK
ncbi:MAG: cytochrome c oxidase subunit II [Actinomycetota bacterium]